MFEKVVLTVLGILAGACVISLVFHAWLWWSIKQEMKNDE